MIAFKGIDDLAAAGLKPRIRPVCFPPKRLTERRAPYVTDGPGTVAAGTDLKSARRATQQAIDRFVRKVPRGHAQLIASPAGTGKTTAVAESLAQHGRSARIVVGTKRLARELAEQRGYHLIEGRNSGNCGRTDIVEALGEKGFPVGPLACGTAQKPRCPFRLQCGYYRQFDAIGTWVGASEQLYNARFLQGASLVVLDDPDLVRASIETYRITPEDLMRAGEQLSGDEGALVRILQHALVDLDTQITGAPVWDHLARVAGSYNQDLTAVVRALPSTGLPRLSGGEVTLDDLEQIPPASLQAVFAALREELPAFLSHEPFNCRLRLHRQGIEVRRLRAAVEDGQGVSLISKAAILILDATPVRALVDHILQDHARLDDVEVPVALPANVTVVQYADRTYGHSSLKNDRAVQEVLDQVRQERHKFPVSSPEDEAVICYTSMKPHFIEMGFAESQVLTFGSVRGTNALATVQRLHVVGRPMVPGAEIPYLAQVVHHDEPVVSEEVVLRPAYFGGQRLAVDVVDYADGRLSALMQATREDELTQCLHRARLFLLEPQQRLEGPEGRRSARLVLHTSQPVPGLRVDELVTTEGEVGPTLNQQREADAETRVRAAWEALKAEGHQPSINMVAKRANSSWRTAAGALGKVLHTSKEKRELVGTATSDENADGGQFGKVLHTSKGEHVDGRPLQSEL